MLLEGENYQVSCFENISDFSERDSNVLPDLFLLDVRLPDGNGADVCELLKMDEQTKHIPVLMMSAHSNFEMMKATCSADGFVAKPFDIDDLLDRVEKACIKFNGAGGSLSLDF
ncbi:Chemotaxis protein CheY [compost metagenome]